MAYGKDAAKTKRPKMTDDEVGAICVEALSAALGGPGTEVSQARLRNLEYYNAEATGELAPPEIEDRSDFVATDVADTIEGMLPQLMRMFVASDDAVEFEAKRPGSEPVAKLATAYINHLFYTRNDGVGIVYDWFKDALLQKVGFVKVWAEEESEDSKQSFEGQSEDQLAMSLQDGWELDGDPEVDEQGGLSFTLTKEDRRICIKCEVCAPDAVRVDPNARWGGDPAMIGHVFRRRKYELEQDGYDLSDLPRGSGDAASSEETLEMLGQSMDSDAYSEPHESHSLYDCAEMYIKLDRDGDGVAEWLKVCLIEDTLAIYDDGKAAIEQVDDHPFVWICPIPRPHAFFGDCPADFAVQPQKLRTNTVRAIVDNMVLTVNTRTFVDRDKVDLDDMLENRPGGLVRVQGDPRLAALPMVQPNLTPPAYQFNEWLESWRENRTGFTRYSQGTDADSLNKTATGVSIITQKADMRLELMARFFAVGMKQLFAKMLKLAVKHQDREEQLQVNGGQWVAVNPSEWRDQFNVKINVGLGTGSKEQQAARIMGLAQMMSGLGVPAGVVGPEHIAEIIRLYVESNEFSNPERFVSPQPLGMPPNPQAYQQERQQVEQQMSEMQQELERLSAEADGLKTDQATKIAEFQLKNRELDLKEQELGFKQTAAVAEHELKRDSHHMEVAKTGREMERADAEATEVDELKQQVAQLTEAVKYLLNQQEGNESISGA